MIRSVLILGVTFSLVLVCTVWLVWQDKERQLHSALNIREPVRLNIEPGTSMSELAIQLTENDWLEHPNYLIFEARLLKKANRIKSGEYLVTPGTTPLELLDLLVSGKVIQHSITLVEGWQFREVRDAIRGHEAIRQTISDWGPASIVNLLNLPHSSPEGLFFPDTYHFPRGTTDAEVLHRAYSRLEIMLANEWQEREQNLPYQSAYDALIMASIIEKETGVAEERGQIAGVFVRRLEKGMKLQTDPTVIYAIGEAFDGDIRHKDLSIDSPFNTYLYAGLPPTPIALAGRNAIHAALHPETGNSLYFVARGDGTHYFSATLKEHNHAVNTYQMKKN